MRQIVKKNKLNIKNKANGKVKYHSKSYQNPYFASKKKNKINISRTLNKKIKIIIALFFLGSAACAWLLIYSDYFIIKDIKVNGAGRIPTTAVEAIAREQIDKNLFVLWPQKNIFLFAKDALAGSLNQKYSFETLRIQKKLPRTLIINYQEKEYTVIWQENNRYFYLDTDGAIVSETSLEKISEKEYPLILNLSAAKIAGSRITAPLDYLNYARDLSQALKEYEDEFRVKNFIIDEELNTIKAELENGPQIYFSTNEDMAKQIEKLIIVKQEKIKNFFNKKTYLDLRYGARVYIR